MDLFKDFKIDYLFGFEGYGWYFKYKGNKHAHGFKGITPEIQIKVVENMLETMKKLKENNETS